MACALDLTKVCYSAWHQGLIYKLFYLNSPPDITKIIKSFLPDRSFFALFENQGLPQGSIRSPHLVNYFLSDFPTTVDDSEAILYAEKSRPI